VRMPPAVVSEGATVTGDTSATITGSVRPRRQATTTFVEIGTTTAYGDLRIGPSLDLANTAAQTVSIGVAGLQPGTLYHYRIRAANPTGLPTNLDVGPDQTFVTGGVGPITAGTTTPPPPTPTPQPPTPHPAPGPCAAKKGVAKTACVKLQRDLQACTKVKNGKTRTTCVRRAKAVAKCAVVKKKGARNACLVRARRIR
jgi:hypothetical protein